MKHLSVIAALALALSPATVSAAKISTHVLDLARGIGGRGVPVVLFSKSSDGRWVELARAQTDDNGRVRSFGAAARFEPGTYKLQFDMTGYPSSGAAPFFPEINLVSR